MSAEQKKVPRGWELLSRSSGALVGLTRIPGVHFRTLRRSTATMRRVRIDVTNQDDDTGWFVFREPYILRRTPRGNIRLDRDYYSNGNIRESLSPEVAHELALDLLDLLPDQGGVK